MFATRRSFDVIKHKAIMTHTFDADKFCLGTLCKQGHEYENTGFSLRYKRNGKDISEKSQYPSVTEL